ncbi:endonuclease/exonuclease/phosphatase family protein [Plakobranchus ocellatus]|uniref:Endonuclease/exonuclease/phosphatase family protein n=1 Tax=Plakobranchus ocellatus TaxID=259542 RepID=A0AAV4A5S5_9GAST|nr:endonuclease/exonuclease/phosphatase family protein [Plakobranchus ocellatus]
MKTQPQPHLGHRSLLYALIPLAFLLRITDEFTINQHKWLLAKPAGAVEQPKNAYFQQWTEEGLAILSKLPFEKFTEINLTRHGGTDTNPRLALHAQLRIGPEPEDVVNVVVIHFSYDKQQQCQNAKYVLNFIAEKALKNVIVLGDFNAYPDFTGPTDILTSMNTTGCRFERPPASLLKDVMLTSMETKKAALTFSNMPSPGFVSRPDRILVSPSFQVKRTFLSGQGESYRDEFIFSILLSRAKRVLRSGYDSFIGKTGYSCLHDCGPHGSCRCGVCVKGGNQLNCDLPDCFECNSTSPQQGDLRLSGPSSGQGTGGGAQTRNRWIPTGLRADSPAIVPLTPPHLKFKVHKDDEFGRCDVYQILLLRVHIKSIYNILVHCLSVYTDEEKVCEIITLSYCSTQEKRPLALQQI